jgi:formate hydrogenlyase subunit 4
MSEVLLDRALSLFQGLVLMALAPGIVGLLNYGAAMLQGRRRLPTTTLQPYRDLARLCRQRSVRAQTGSWLFAAAPVVIFAAYSALLFAVPAFGHDPLLRLDLITVVYLLALARFTVSLAGLDSAAPFGALGSSREMSLHLQTEIGMALFLAGLALNRGLLDISALSAAQTELRWGLWLRPDLLLLAAALAVIILYEAGRIPIGNPTTELELTMAREAVAGEYAGRDLALIDWAEAMKLTFLLVLAVSMFPLPIWRSASPVAFVVSGGVHLGQLVGLIALLAFWEVTRPKLRLRKVSGPMLMSAVFSLTAILYAIAAGTRS